MKTILEKVRSWFKGTKTETAPNTLTGTVKYFNYKKGYGFIQCEQVSADIFVHAKDTEGGMRKGRKVSFLLDQNEKGYIARKVVSLTQKA